MDDQGANAVFEQNSYLDTRHAAEYLQCRESDFLGDKASTYTSNKVSALARGSSLKSTRIADCSSYLFKVEWLEDYLKDKHGESYTLGLGDANCLDVNGQEESVQNSSESLVETNQNDLSERDSENVDPSNSSRLVNSIKNHPVVVYLGSAFAGFMLGVGTDIGASLIESDILAKDRVSLSEPIEKETGDRLLGYILAQKPATEFGSNIRRMMVNVKGPFAPMKKELKLYLVDPEEYLANNTKLAFVKEHAAVVCSNSPTFKSRLTISAKDIEGIKIPTEMDESLAVFHAFLEDDVACHNSNGEESIENVMINRAVFEERFRVDSGVKKYLIVQASVSVN